MSLRLILASASAGRLAVLRGAGLDPEQVVSGVDEGAATGSATQIVAELARRKASAVAALPGSAGTLVLGCDSLLELDGLPLGKPADAAEAIARWGSMRGRTGSLLTGHCLVDMRADSCGPARTEEVGCAQVRFGEPDDVELAAYVASGEPMAVAGGFTIDGLGGWFVDSVTGAPSTVVGLSLPVLRRLLAAHGVSVADLWAARQRAVRS